MENKEIATSGKITSELIGGWILYSILFGIIYYLISSFINSLIPSLVLKAIVVIVLEGIFMFLIWKSSTASTFKKRTMNYSDVPTVMRNLLIFTIIICVINGIYNFYSVNKAIDTAIATNVELQLLEYNVSTLKNSKQMKKYEEEKNKAIAEAKSQLYTYLSFLEVGLTAVSLAILPLEKKQILKYVQQ